MLFASTTRAQLNEPYIDLIQLSGPACFISILMELNTNGRGEVPARFLLRSAKEGDFAQNQLVRQGFNAHYTIVSAGGLALLTVAESPVTPTI